MPAVVLHLEGQPAGEPGGVQEDREGDWCLTCCRGRHPGTTCPRPGSRSPPCCRSPGLRTEMESIMYQWGRVKVATNLGRSTASLELGSGVPEVAQPEVSDDDFGVILVQKDVFELDVSVNDLLGVEVADAR